MLTIDNLILETDAPYLAPEPFRGKRNESSYLTYVAKEIAGIKSITPEEVILKTRENAYNLYKKLQNPV